MNDLLLLTMVGTILTYAGGNLIYVGTGFA
jgi:hypothetical protein